MENRKELTNLYMDKLMKDIEKMNCDRKQKLEILNANLLKLSTNTCPDFQQFINNHKN